MTITGHKPSFCMAAIRSFFSPQDRLKPAVEVGCGRDDLQLCLEQDPELALRKRKMRTTDLN
jgi:hypothetical protein